MSDTEPRMTRTRVRQACKERQEDEEISEVESCCSAVSVSKAGQSSRRSTRRKPIPERSDPAHVEAGDVKVDTESCSSESQRVTRSQRKTTRTRPAAKQQTEDSEVSDVDSCTSRASRSTTRRSTRSRRQTCPIPIDLDEASEASGSPAQTGRRSRAARGKTTVNEAPSCDSEGFESGSTYSMSTRRRGKNQSTDPKVLESESDLTDVQSPVGSPRSSRGKGTPCSSRTGSGNSSRGVSVTRSSIKNCSIVVTSWEPAKEDSLLQDSRLESTLIAEDADCTLLEEDKSHILEEKEKEDVNSSDLASNEALAADSGETEDVQGGSALQKATEGAESRVNVISEDDSHVSPSVSEGLAAEVVCETAVMARDQQVEPPAENKDGDTSEVEMMQETVLPSELLKPSETVPICETVSENIEETKDKEEAMEVANEDTHPSQGVEHVYTVMETQSSKEEEMEVSTLNTDAQQVVDSSEAQVESIEVTSSQDHKITVDSSSEQQSKDVIVQNTKVISLLVSSEDEDDYEEEEEREVSGEEEEEKDLAEERGRTSKKSEAAAESVAGLFMIDTRPGQAADENYYKDRLREEEEVAGRSKEGAEQEEQDEEFVDEEDDDDDDEDAEILFSSRDPQS